MATECEELGGSFNPEAFNAAVTVAVKHSWIHQKLCRKTEGRSLREILSERESTLSREVLSSVTPGGENTLLHLAASLGNVRFVQEFLELNLKLVDNIDTEVQSLLVKATNAQGNTALHLAAQGGFSDVVEALLRQQENGVNVCNKLGETPLFKAYESGNLKTVEALFAKCPSNLLSFAKGTVCNLDPKTEGKRTCLTVAINRGDSDLVHHILELDKSGKSNYARQLIQERDEYGNTALHIAVGSNYKDIIKKLIDFEPKLCYWVNDSQETPLCVAAKLGHLEAVKKLIKKRPDAVEIRNSCGMNVLHLAAQVNQARIVDWLNERVGLSYLVNQGLDNPPEEKSGGNADPSEKNDPFSEISRGDTPLHIAARKRSLNMVNSLLRIKGINKFAVNKEGLTALDIVRENTEYHESNRIIAVLSNYPSKRKPFLYSSPKVCAQKYENAIQMVNKAYDDRRSTELVVAVLLATMAFTAAFTVPGSFVSDDGNGNKSLGSPILLGLRSFKIFLISDCLAFFLSLFVVLMWQMSTPITTGNKILFVCITNLLVCATFAFTAYGFMAAVYSMLANDAPKLAWFILGACLIICFCGNFTFLYMGTKFFVTKARFNHLNGLTPLFPDRVGKWVWKKLERWGLLTFLRQSEKKWLDIFYFWRTQDKHIATI
ncbi:hypothetical protein SUGI_0696920 [Cryptomeria japonica]|uniref:ankyrin repeat-containing protein At5g02620-like n=1 Tax=Cryptomeria japonica TaxID=3369 RepID=UPI0024148C51|nr:ankyrin repeat-containing protein At5g02620-like [Cryptomeria japonica]GLJ34649.1 hypothetical protein SUGI_0696920 [Cryptomeria japonica]